MNSGTQKSYGSRSGIQASQVISRDVKASETIALGNVSENLNRFLSAHSRRNFNQNSRKFRLNEYFTKDLKAKTSSTHHFLCGPLNTKRLTRKTISGNFDDESTTTQTLNVADLYNNSKQINKPPWIEQTEHCNISEHRKKSPEPKATVSFDLNPRFNENSTTSTTRLDDGEKVLQDGQVPDPMHIDLQDSCPLYDSNEYQQRSSPIDEKKTSDDEDSEPDVPRYNFFVASSSLQKHSNIDFNDSVNRDRREDRINNDTRREPIPREKVFVPLLTSSQDYDFSAVE